MSTRTGGLYTYPDAMVIGGPPTRVRGRQNTVTNPALLVEVLSEATCDYDRGEKLVAYQAMSMLGESLLVEQDAVAVERVHQPEAGTCSPVPPESGAPARPGRRLKSRADRADTAAHGTATKHGVHARWSTRMGGPRRGEGSAHGPRGGAPLRCRLRPRAGRIDPPGGSRCARRAGGHGGSCRALAGHHRRFRERSQCPGPAGPARDARPGPRRHAGDRA